MTPEHVMSAFTPPFSIRLYGGLRANAFRLPVEILEEILNVHLGLEDDLELGGAYYSFAPDPPPAIGLTGVRLHANDVPGLGLTYDARPDLLSLLTILFRSSSLLDLGRLDWQLRKAYGDLFDVAQYSVVSLPSPDDPSFAPPVHWVEFEAAQEGSGTALGDTPILDCRIEFELDEGDQAPVLEKLPGMREANWVQWSVDSMLTGDGRAHLTLQFQAHSLLESGRLAQAVESGSSGANKVSGYRIAGDLLRDGSLVSVENTVDTPSAGYASSSS